MIQTIIDYIVMAIRANFEEVKIYDEQVKQGLTEPCFIVKCVNPTNQLEVKNRYKRNNLFSVKYFPKSQDNAKSECYDVCERLFTALEIIGIEGDLIRGTGASAEVVDGVLVFTINYNLFVTNRPETEQMETLNIENIEVKENESKNS